MIARQARYSPEEFARRGQAIFQRSVQPVLRPEDDGKFAAIDIESGNFVLDRDDYRATELLLNSTPEAQIWLMRVGQPTAYRIGRGVSGGGGA